MKKKITDANALGQYIDLLGAESKEFILDIVDTFLDDSPKQFAQLDQSIATQDSVTFHRAAHTLKSSLKIIGAVEMADACLKLENIGASGKLENVEKILTDLKNDYSALESELANMKNEL